MISSWVVVIYWYLILIFNLKFQIFFLLQEKAIGNQNILANVIRVKKSDSEVLEALACDSFVVKSAKPGKKMILRIFNF